MVAGVQASDGRTSYVPFYWRVLGHSDIDLLVIYEGDAENAPYEMKSETNGRQLMEDLHDVFLESEIAMLKGQKEGVGEYLSLLLAKALEEDPRHPIITRDFPFAYKSFQRRRGLEAASKIDDAGGRIFSRMVGLYREIEAGVSVTEFAVEMNMRVEDINPQQRFDQALAQIPTTEQFAEQIKRTKVKYTPEEMQDYVIRPIGPGFPNSA